MVPTGTFTITVAFGSNGVPGTLPVTEYEPGAVTSLLSAGAGQITRTAGRRPAPSGVEGLSRYTAGIAYGRCGSVPTVVSTVISGTCDSHDASGDSFGIAAVEMT